MTTEERIKVAARKVFHQKGYAGTRTRDIAEEAGINHAMVNYYFRSKEKLFGIVMLETMTFFFKGVSTMLLEEPELPTFMFNEVRTNPEPFVANTPILQALEHSVLARQYAEAVAQGRITEPNLIHTVLNVISLVIFPFIAQPIFTALSRTNKEAYKALMLERKKLIPQWIKAMLFVEEKSENKRGI